jgi:hypothetical protein
MNESEHTPTPVSVWKSMNGEGLATMDITFSPDQLCAMARSRERESIWSRRILLLMLIGLAAGFAYNVFSVSQFWVRLSQVWMLAWTGLLVWRFGHTPRRMSAGERCASFLRRELENKRSGLLEIQRYIFLLIPPILACWWGGGRPAGRLSVLGVQPSSRLYGFASGPWVFIIVGLLLVVVWTAFGLAARKTTRELDELARRTQE